MRHACLISIWLVLASKLLGADVTSTEQEQYPAPPPSYKILRFQENYSYLSNVVNRTDFFDPIKYIPLWPGNPLWYLTVGGEVRWRFEGNYDQNLGVGDLPANSYWLQRATLLTDWHFGPRARLFVEGISGIIEGNSLPAPPVQQDPIDLAYAFVDFVPYLNGDASLTLRAGRLGLSLGSGRLVATRAAPPAPNIPFRFDGFQSFYKSPLWQLTAFLTQPAADTGGFNGENHSTTFWGLYGTHWFDQSKKSGADLYYLGIYNKDAVYASGTANETRHSFGVRIFGQRNQWDWNQEDVIQTGTFGNNSIFAWTASLDAGYTWATTWQPRLGLKINAASGSSSTNGGTLGTFNALFPNPDYFNDASVFRPANFVDLHPYLSADLTRDISVNGGAGTFWRYSRNDAIYAPSGAILVPALGNQPAFFATAVDVNFQWQIQRHVTLYASYVHFFTSEYVHAAGGRDMNFVSTTMSFLF